MKSPQGDMIAEQLPVCIPGRKYRGCWKVTQSIYFCGESGADLSLYPCQHTALVL